jgi:hypothetical protein
MHFNVRKFLINSLPFLLLGIWRLHFGVIYIGFPSQFVEEYHPGWTCETVSVPGGMCEDVIHLEYEGLVLMTCDGNRRKWNTVMVREREDVIDVRVLWKIQRQRDIYSWWDADGDADVDADSQAMATARRCRQPGDGDS